MKNSDLARLQSLYHAQALPHAWIFTCADLAYGLQTAQTFSQWLLCNEKVADLACGKCKACHLFTADVHPDYCFVLPQEDKQSILIQDIRNATDFATSKPQFSAVKVVLIYPAHGMHMQSANALLKSLEEPPSHTIYILVTSNVDLLPMTITSRCHALNLHVSNNLSTDTKAQVQIMVGDLHKLWLQKSVTTSQIVEQWLKQWPGEVLYWFELVLTDVIRFKYTANVLDAKAWCDEEQSLCNALSDHKFWTILEQLRRAQYLVGHNHKPNMQLLLEDMLLV